MVPRAVRWIGNASFTTSGEHIDRREALTVKVGPRVDEKIAAIGRGLEDGATGAWRSRCELQPKLERHRTCVVREREPAYGRADVDGVRARERQRIADYPRDLCRAGERSLGMCVRRLRGESISEV